MDHICVHYPFGYDVRLFYYALYAFYNNVRTSNEKYQLYYELFLQVLYSYLVTNDYFKYDYIKQEDWDYFKEYFDLEGEIIWHEIIKRRYLLKEEYAKNPFCIKVVKYIRNFDFETEARENFMELSRKKDNY